MRKVIKILVFGLFLSFAFQANQAFSQRPIHEIHSMLIYNFIKYVEWPPSSKSGDFVIAVYGDNAIYNQLNKFYASKPIKGQNVRVKKVDNAGQIGTAHILYLADNKSGDFDEVSNKLGSEPTLIITDKNGLGKKGANINFKTISGKLKFEVNKSAFDKKNLKISNQLVSMAIVI